MPHLIYGGRLWRFSSDELSLPASCAASSRCLWSVLLLLLLGLTAQSVQQCSGQGHFILGYLLAALALQAVNVACEVCIIRHSLRGTMVESKPRDGVTSYLTLHLLLSLLQFACALYGMLVINLDFIPCNSVFSEDGMAALLYVVIISQLVDISGIMCCATMFSSRTVEVGLHVDEDDLSPHSAHSRASRSNSVGGHLEHPDLGLVGPSGEDLLQWEKRCGSLCRRLQLLTCNLFGGAGVGDDLATVGRVFSNFFHHEGFLDVVPSDVMAGFLLVRFQQKITKIRNREARVKMITQQGIQFERQPAKYGTKSTCVLSVPSFRKTPQLDDAKRIVTAAKEGVVLRPVSDRYSAVEMTKSVSPHPDSQGNNRAGVVGLSALPVQTGETSKTTEKSNDEAKAPSVVESTLPPAAPSRYSPSMKRSVSWNSSEQTDSVIPNATNHKKESSSPLPVTNSPPQTSSFKTRTSYFSALEVLERNSSQKMSRSKGMGSIDVAVTGTTASDNNNCSMDLGSGHDMHSTINFDEFSDVARFSYFALAAYSTLMFLYMNPCSGGCKLCTYGCCPEAALGTCCGTDSSSPQASHSRQQPSSQGTNTPVGKQVEHDNKCHTNESAMRQMVKAPNTELVYAQFSNDIETRPYAVFLDYEKEALVITVRGTLSLEDCVADAMSEPEPLDVVGMQYGFNGVGRHAHSGFLKSAQWICEDLFKHPQVAFLLSSVAGTNPTGMTMDRDGSMDSSAGSLTNTLGSPLKPRTVSRLVIVGHSLGAGVASLLALLMKRDYPTLHCFGYGAPGSTMDDETAHEAKSYATSVVLGDDMVGSLSFHSLSVLREEVLDSIVRSRCSKMSILQMTMFKECSEELVDELLYAPGQEPTSAFRTMFLKYKAHMKRQRSTFLPCPLFIPGKVVHLRQIGKEKDRSSLIGSVGRVFVPVIEPHRSFFEEIKVSATMITDHLPDLYCSELNAMLHDWAIERHTQQKLLAVHGVATESEKFLSTNDNQV